MTPKQKQMIVSPKKRAENPNVLARQVRNLNGGIFLEPGSKLDAIVSISNYLTLPVPEASLTTLFGRDDLLDDVSSDLAGIERTTTGLKNGNIRGCNFVATHVDFEITTSPMTASIPGISSTRTSGATPNSSGGVLVSGSPVASDSPGPACPVDAAARNAVAQFGYDEKVAMDLFPKIFAIRVKLCDLVTILDLPVCDFMTMSCGPTWACCGETQIAVNPYVRRMNAVYSDRATDFGKTLAFVPINNNAGSIQQALTMPVALGGPSMIGSGGAPIPPIFATQRLPITAELYRRTGTDELYAQFLQALGPDLNADDDGGASPPSDSFDRTVCGLTTIASDVLVMKYGMFNMKVSLRGFLPVGEAVAQIATVNLGPLSGLPPEVKQFMHRELSDAVQIAASRNELPSTFIGGLPTLERMQEMASMVSSETLDETVKRLQASPMRQSLAGRAKSSVG